MFASLWTVRVVHAESDPPATLNRTPPRAIFTLNRTPPSTLNRTPPKPVRFAVKFFL